MVRQRNTEETDNERERWFTSVRGGEGGRRGWISQTREPWELLFCVTSVKACDDSTPVIWSKVTPPQCDSVASECCIQACSALLEDESLNLSLLFLEKIPFLCSRVSAPKGTLVSASPPHKACRRLDETICWALGLIRCRYSLHSSIHAAVNMFCADCLTHFIRKCIDTKLDGCCHIMYSWITCHFPIQASFWLIFKGEIW